MKRVVRWGMIGLAAVMLAGCTAGSPATIIPSPTPELQQAMAPESTAPVVETGQVETDQAAPEPTPTETPPAPDPAADPIVTEPPTVAQAPVEMAPDAAAAPQDEGVTGDPAADEVAVDTAAAPDSANAGAEAGTDTANVAAAPETANVETGAAAANPAAEGTGQELAYRSQSAGRLPPPAAPADGSLLTVSRGPSGRMEVALTFDAGADTGYAADILDLLQAYGIKATFGMTGVWAEQNPDLIRRMANEGHQLMNHTYDHSSFTGVSTGAEPQTFESMLWQLNQTEQIVWDIAGYEMKPYVRPPYGDFGPMTSGFMVDAGYFINVMWTCDSFGWKGWDAAQIVSHCTTDIGPGEIILLHVGASAPGDYESLPGLIEIFSQAGYSFVTIEQMLQP